MTLVLARLPLARLLRTPRSWGLVVLWAAVGIVSAVMARRGTTGADHVMRGAFASIVLPLVAFVIVGAALGGSGMKRAVRSLVALGAAPRRAALVSTVVASAASAIVCGVLAVIVCAIAHGAGDAPLARDLVTSFGVSMLGGATYAAYFSAGSAIGKGMFRGGFLVIDWIFASGVGAVLTPRGELTALLGGALPADIPARACSVILVVQLVLYTLLAVFFSRRP